MKLLYAITHIDCHGLRTLTRGNDGLNHFDAPEQALEALRMFKPELRKKLDRKYVKTLAVSEITCHDSGEAFINIVEPNNTVKICRAKTSQVKQYQET